MEENTYYFTLGAVRYCFPFDIDRLAYTEGQEDQSLLGVLEPWAGKRMTEFEANSFLCHMIKKKPVMEHAMSVSVSVMKHNKSGVSYYQTLMFRTENQEKGPYDPTPIKWGRP